tara:strand:- start:103 stop:687 length:585 start_codon:yes stop_codon:yes gene_type:complete
MSENNGIMQEITDFNSNDNWIEEYHDKHNTFPLVKILLASLGRFKREELDERAVQCGKEPYTEEMWEELKSSIKKRGLKKDISVYEDIRRGKMSYVLRGGHHRACILHELYGYKHKVKVKVTERRNFVTENRIKLKSINPINIHKTSSHTITKKVHDNLQQQIDSKLADIKSKSVNNKKQHNLNKVNKTYKDYL